MKLKVSSFAMTFFAVSTIFVSTSGWARPQQFQSTEIIFRGSEAKMSLNLFKFQLRNKISGLNLNLKFVALEKEIEFDIQGLRTKEIKRRLTQAISANHNCKIIKENEPDQINGEVGYRECLSHASRAETILALNSRFYSSWMARVVSEKKLSVAREEMALEAVNTDSDTVSILTSLAQDVQDEVNFLYPRSPVKVSEVSVMTHFVSNPN